MGLPWIKLYADLPSHPKSLDLGLELGNPLAWAHVVQMWCWASRFSARAVLRRTHVELAAGWAGAPGKFLAAALKVGFLEADPDDSESVFIHDWDVTQLPHLEKAERDAAEKARKRRENGARRKLPRERVRDRGDEKKQEKKPADEPPPIGADQKPLALDLTSAPPTLHDLDAILYSRWRELYAPRAAATLDRKRRKFVQERRAERAAGGSPPDVVQRELIEALEGWQFDSWKDRRRNVKFTQLFRDSDQVDKGLELWEQRPRAPEPAPPCNFPGCQRPGGFVFKGTHARACEPHDDTWCGFLKAKVGPKFTGADAERLFPEWLSAQRAPSCRWCKEPPAFPGAVGCLAHHKAWQIWVKHRQSGARSGTPSIGAEEFAKLAEQSAENVKAFEQEILTPRATP